MPAEDCVLVWDRGTAGGRGDSTGSPHRAGGGAAWERGRDAGGGAAWDHVPAGDRAPAWARWSGMIGVRTGPPPAGAPRLGKTVVGSGVDMTVVRSPEEGKPSS